MKSKVAEKQRPEDAAAIAELRARINEANILIESKDAYIAEITQRDINQIETVNQLNDSVAGPGNYIPHLTGAAKRREKETF